MLISIFNLHRWKDIWGEDAEKFNPDEHFSDESVAKRHPYAYLPFSGGSRNCLGYQYAMISAKIGLIKLLTKFRFATKLKMENFDFSIYITMPLRHGYLVEANLRNQ